MKKYESIYHDLLALIENNKIKAGEKLSSEFDLQNKYQASRDTIRKALLLLSQNGYIQKSQGKGSIVLDINRFNFPVSGLTSFKEIASDIKGKVETIVHTCECIEPDEEIKKLLMLKSGTKVWYIERVRKLYDKTLYEDFSKKVDLSNGLPTNSTLDKDKNGPYMIDISFYSPILDIIYLYNDEFPVY